MDRRTVLESLYSEEFANVPPCEIIPTLAVRGEYIASESTFYRILREEKNKIIVVEPKNQRKDHSTPIKPLHRIKF